MKTRTMAAVCAAAIVPAALFADKVTLNSGSTLSGTAGVIRDGKVAFVSDDLGEILIPLDKIAALDSKAVHVFQYNDGRKEKIAATVEEGVIVHAGDGKTGKVDMSDVKAVDPVEEKWQGSVNLSATATRGNTVGESATVIADASRRWENDRFTGALGYYFAQSGDSKQDKQKTVSRFEANAQFDHFWSQKFYGLVKGKYEFDRIMDLEYRGRVGLGLGYQWLEKQDLGFGALSFNQEAGVAYVLEKYDHDSRDDYASAFYAHHLNWTVASVEGLEFFHNFDYLPDFEDLADNYILDTDVGISYAFRPDWQLLAKAEWDYKSKVGKDTKHSDIRYILGIGYKW